VYKHVKRIMPDKVPGMLTKREDTLEGGGQRLEFVLSKSEYEIFVVLRDIKIQFSKIQIGDSIKIKVGVYEDGELVFVPTTYSQDELEIDTKRQVLFKRLCDYIKEFRSDDGQRHFNRMFSKVYTALSEIQAKPVKVVTITPADTKPTTTTLIDGRTRLRLPEVGKHVSDFANELADVVHNKDALFFRTESRDIVEIGKIRVKKDGEEKYTGFLVVSPDRLVTLAEKYVSPYVTIFLGGGELLEKDRSMTAALAKTLIASDILQRSLAPIHRIFTIPLPIMYNKELTFPCMGYDERFASWLPDKSPKISKPDMTLEEAKKIFDTIFKEFCFQTDQDRNNAIAGLITPYLRGLFPSFTTRTPVFFYVANRERAGKDFLAGISGIVYEGCVLEESPISTSENARSNHTEELRKKLLAALISGRKRVHFSNNKGYLNNAVFEAIVTAEKWADRVLGRSEILELDNELDFSLSGNSGIGFTPDFANRCRFVRLFLDIEDANSRWFENPDLHKWVLENRELIISAMYALVRNWIEKGKPKGSLAFSSFPAWANICGGVMEAAGYLSPCVPDAEVVNLGGDSETNDMKALFEGCYDEMGERWVKSQDIKDLVRADADLFGYLDFEKRSDQTKFGNKLVKFAGRVLSDIRLIVKDTSVRKARWEYSFTKNIGRDKKDGNLGNNGNPPHPTLSTKEYNIGGVQVPYVTGVAKNDKDSSKNNQKKLHNFSLYYVARDFEKVQGIKNPYESDIKNILKEKYKLDDEAINNYFKKAEENGDFFISPTDRRIHLKNDI